MRKYLPYRVLLVPLILAFSCKRSEFRRDGTPRQAAIVMDSMSADFGTFPKSAGVQRTVFTFKNEGDADLEFQVVDPSCGCVLQDLCGVFRRTGPFCIETWRIYDGKITFLSCSIQKIMLF